MKVFIRIFMTFLFIQNHVVCQDFKAKQIGLEKKSQKLKEEINQINSLLFLNKKIKKSTLTKAEDVELKISIRKELISINNQQVNSLEKLININQRDISKYRKDIEKLKTDYSEMIDNAYKSKSKQNRLIFIFSSENFLQAYKRLNYLNQYSSYRKKQVLNIEKKTKILQELNKDLIVQKQKRRVLVENNRQEQRKLIEEQNQQNKILADLKKKSKSFTKQIRIKQLKAESIDKEIQKLIREAIVLSNKKEKINTSDVFKLTPEAKLLADNFRSNKGKLPWPVSKGVIIQKYGMQTHPLVKTTKIKSSGITIASVDNAKVRTVFEGQVMAILSFKNSNPTILVKHGNYITAYKNLSKVYVKKGQYLDSKETIGEVFTNLETGRTILQFSVFNAMKPENPTSWLYNK
ncbi:MAG: peptidase M23 [Flavobacteriaceae bacterium]|nr:peptidase M23 [Flavobacteriaceae bacterium]